MRRATALATAIATCSAGVLCAAGSASAASTQPTTLELNTALPFNSVADMVVDTQAGHIFVSGGTSYIEVLSLSGQVLGQIANEQGVTGLALSFDGSTLYAADEGSDSIAVINANTLQQTASYPTTGLSPVSAAVAGGELWFTTTSTLDVKEVDLATGAVSSSGQGASYYGAKLVSSPYAPDTLISGTYGMSPSTIHVFTVDSGALTLETGASGQLNSSGECDNLGGMAVTPDGQSLVVTCGSPYYAIEVSLNGLNNENTYTTGPYPSSAAVSADGRILVGVEDGAQPVAEFAPGDSTATGGYGVTPGTIADSEFVPYVAWGANDSVLYAVVTGYETAPTLEAIYLSSSLSLSSPSVVTPGSTYSVTGSLTSAGAGISGAAVTVTRTENGTSTTVGSYTTDSAGAFGFTDKSAPVGTTATYTATVVGSSATLSTTASTASIPVAYPLAPSKPKPVRAR